MTATADRIVQLISYGWTDWAVTASERAQVLAAIRADGNLPATIRALHDRDYLQRMLNAFRAVGAWDRAGGLSELLQLLGAGAGASAGALIEAWRGWPTLRYRFLFQVSRDLHERLRSQGARLAASSNRPTSSAGLLPSGDQAATGPFGGVGATGVPASSLSVPLGDQFSLWREDAATTARYRNPIPGDLGAYLSGLTPRRRRDQARLLLTRPINTIVPYSYVAGRPSRADVITAAARAFRLQPALLGAFILAEQRDQSRNEDAVEYTAARNPIAQGNTSIGLGQIVVSTARREDLFQPLLGGVRTGLTHDQIAELLVSEEFNIFGVAKYLRAVADRAAPMDIARLPETARTFPGISMPAYGQSSERWPDDNIRALGSEYTSRAWDDRLSPGWGGFVFEAYRDMRGSGLFQ